MRGAQTLTAAPGVKLHTGPIFSAVAGRTDHLPMHVPAGSYVLPADIVSHYGEGNTAAGFKALRRLFGAPHWGSAPPPNANSGAVIGVPIIAAGGEYVLSPEQVRQVGEGDLDLGHRVLDEFVKRSRAELVNTLSKLPGPKRD